MVIYWKHLDTLANAQILGGAYLGSEDGKYVVMARRYRRGDKGRREYVVHYTTVEYVGSYRTGGANRTLYDGSSLEKAKAAAEVAVGGTRDPEVGAAGARLTKKEIEDAADAQGLGVGLDLYSSPDGSTRSARFDKYARKWIVEYNTDPAIVYVASRRSDGSIQFDRIDDQGFAEAQANGRRKHEDQLVTDPVMLPAKLSARYVADLKKAGVTSEVVESRTTMPRGWDYGNLTTLKSGDYLITFTVLVAHLDLDQASGHAMIDSQVVSMQRAAKAEPVIAGMISDVADQLRPMRENPIMDTSGYQVGDRLELRLERHPIYSRRDVPTYRETTKRVTVKIVGEGYLVVHDGTHAFRLEGHEMGNRTTRYHVLSLKKISHE